MKAISYDEYGGTEKLKLNEVPIPVYKENEILIKISAVSVNDYDIGMLMGKPRVVRVQNGFWKPEKVHILGSDIAGTVEAVGASVTRFKIGDRVFGDLSDRWGGFAEYCCAGETEVEQMSESLSFEEAAALPQAGALAYQGLFEYGRLKRGEGVLINGAGGGVGTLGVQMAKAEGAVVAGVDAAFKFDSMKALGFEALVDYNTTDFTALDAKYDVILDNKLNRSIFQCLRALNPGGRYLIAGGDTVRLFQALIVSVFINRLTDKTVGIIVLKKNSGLDHMKKLHAAGKLKVIMEEPVPLERGIEAIEAYYANRFSGKVLITNV